MRCIDADTLKENYCKDCSFCGYVMKCEDNCIACKSVNKTPTLDVQPVVHAHWFEDEDCHRCSNCKAVLEEEYKWHVYNYCYHCGARMDKE